jgi:hypothetical protein
MTKSEEMAISSAIARLRRDLSSDLLSDLRSQFGEISYRLTEIEAAIAHLTELIESGSNRG